MHAQVIVELQEKGASPVAVKQTLSSFLDLAPSQVGPTRPAQWMVSDVRRAASQDAWSCVKR